MEHALSLFVRSIFADNNGDEENERQVAEVQRIEHERLQQVVNRQRDDEHEGNGYAET